MRCEHTTKTIDNNGFTLVEILVALAVSGIVILMIGAMMTNGSFLFKNESNKINLQNELQMVDNFLSETLLEAKALHIVYGHDLNTGLETTRIYTGKRNKDSGALIPVELPNYDTSEGATTAIPAITTERIITYVKDEQDDVFGPKQGIYINNSYVPAANLTKGFSISGSVTNFTVRADSSCVVRDEKGEISHYTNPIVLNIEVTVTDGNKSKTAKYTYRLRNKIEEIQIANKTYKVK